MRVEAINLLRSSGTKANSEIIEVHSQGGEETEHLNLREDPSAMARIAAASQHPPLAGFLAAINGEGSLFSTVGIKVWTSDPLANGRGHQIPFSGGFDLRSSTFQPIG